MQFDFKGKRVVVTGGSRGIGRATAEGFAKAGAKVSICARGAGPLEAARQALGPAGHAARCDLSDPGAIESYIAEAAKALGGIDILINNASGFGSTDDEAGWMASVTVDLLGTVRMSRAATPHLLQGKDPSIVHISSIAAFKPSVRTTPYGAVKAALVQYTTTQAAALARKGVRVNCVAPGPIEFPGGVWDRRKTENPKLYETTLKSCPFGRMGTAEEVADVVLYLASPAARWVTAQTIIVDGGQMLGA